ncbi:MAG: hypothetical protein CMM95_01525 [Rickettsiales bacterium]|nr:hypothetical protein [Rickettsiales bacterium]|tara:strand:- start:77 stop:739 length:663 start_codon:yes stop_codon:yes gene_type:complete
MLSKKISLKQVEEYLRNNPDFFLNNPDILNSMKFPLSSNKECNETNNQVISFKDWLINNLKDKQKSIIENAKHNYFTQKKVHDAVISIIFKGKKDLFEFINNELPSFFDLAIINVITSKEDVSKEYGLIYASEEKINKVYNNNESLIMDAADESLGFYDEMNLKIYSNAIFSLKKEIFNSQSLLVFASKDRQFLTNRAFDLILFLSKIVQQRMKELQIGQ